VSRTAKVIILIAIIAGCLPVLRTQALYDVDVTWTIRESTPQDRRVTFQGASFVIPAGQAVTQEHRLRGGSQVALLFSISGWGFSGKTLNVDGIDLSPSSIHRISHSGTFRILGIGRAPTMTAEIEM
jgi:hypothetical protein